MKLLAICIGQPEKLDGKKTKTGINKYCVPGPVIVDENGLVGDAICNRKYHGGPDQAVYLEGALTLDWWSQQLGRALEPGTFGENLVIENLDNQQVCVGDRFVIGPVVLEATSPRTPCATFAAKMEEATFSQRYRQAARPGIYCRVLSAGLLEAGMKVEHLAFTGAKVAIADMLTRPLKKLSNDDVARYLATPLHTKLKQELEKQARL